MTADDHVKEVNGILHKPIQRIALISGGFEPSRDAVADYLRQLVPAFAARGVECMMVALNDRLIQEFSEFALDGPTARIRVVRIPSRLPLSERVARARTALESWKPDWVSMAMVVYSFNPKGVLIPELIWLPNLLAPYALHVQLHELWIGESINSSLKDVVIGTLQRRTLITLLRRLSPEVLHTHIPYYQRALRRHGIAAGLLPLGVGNIPILDRSGEQWLFPAIRQGGGPDLAVGREAFWLIGMFGGIIRDWPSDDATRTLTLIRDIAARAGRQVVIASIGHIGAHGRDVIERWRHQFPQMSFIVLGPHSESEVSEFFNTIDFGLSSYPIFVLGKSGSAAAMLDHGVPIIVSWGDIDPGAPPILGPLGDLVWRDDDRLESRMLRPPQRIRNYDGPQKVVDQLLAELEQIPHKIRHSRDL